MAKDFNYERDKATTTNTTPINLVPLGAESPGTPAAFAAGEAGNTGITLVNYTADADESGGVDVQQIGRFTITPSINDETGKLSFAITFVPVDGAGTDLDQQAVQWDHPQLMDDWQTAAGRARQA